MSIIMTQMRAQSTYFSLLLRVAILNKVSDKILLPKKSFGGLHLKLNYF